MKKKTIRDLNIEGKRLLIRVDFNVPLLADGSIANDQRIRESLRTIRYALKHNARVIVMSHLGRPSGNPDRNKTLKMDVVAKRLRVLLPDTHLEKCDEVVGSRATAMSAQLRPGELMLLENLRFHPGEKNGDKVFASELRALADIYINDAFACCHRKDASMYAVPILFSKENCAIGFLVEKEIGMLDQLLLDPKRPAVVLLGGAKVADKLGVIADLLPRFDHVLIGGALAYTCLKAVGKSVGASIVANEILPEIKKMEAGAASKIELPSDHVITNLSEPSADCRIVDGAIPEGWAGMDIGPHTIEAFCKILATAGTIVWNGPLGKFEDERFQSGTLAVAKCVISSHAVSVVGGGETSEALEKFDLASKVTFVSTGGGAFLEFLKGEDLPALSVLSEVGDHEQINLPKQKPSINVPTPTELHKGDPRFEVGSKW